MKGHDRRRRANARARRMTRRAERSDTWAVRIEPGDRIVVTRGRGRTDAMRSALNGLDPSTWTRARVLPFVPLNDARELMSDDRLMVLPR